MTGFLPETWSKESGSLVDPHDLAETILKNETIEGITVSGGEPTEQPYAVAELLACMKLAGKIPGKRFAVVVDEAHSSQTGEGWVLLKKYMLEFSKNIT